MKLDIFGKNIAVTESLEKTLEEKMKKLNKHLGKETTVRIVLRVEKLRHIVEIVIPVSKNVIKVEESAADMYETIDKAVSVTERQLKKYKNKIDNKKHSKETIRKNFDSKNQDEKSERKIVKRKVFSLKPMSIEEAILQMEMLGHSFFVFLNADTEETNVIYNRKDHNIGLIETNF
jgi:putative sigma-54 modulation protein